MRNFIHYKIKPDYCRLLFSILQKKHNFIRFLFLTDNALIEIFWEMAINKFYLSPYTLHFRKTLLKLSRLFEEYWNFWILVLCYCPKILKCMVFCFYKSIWKSLFTYFLELFGLLFITFYINVELIGTKINKYYSSQIVYSRI